RVGVAADNAKDKLTLTFNGPYTFDLADAVATLPMSITGIDSDPDHDSVVVRFSFANKVDIRTFREDNSYVVDVSVPEGRVTPRQEGAVRSDELSTVAAELAGRKSGPAEAAEAPRTVPARQGGLSDIRRAGESIALTLPFNRPTPAAVFRRGDVLWLVFDSDAVISLAELNPEIGHSVKSAAATRTRDASIVRLKLERPFLASATAEGGV